MTVGAKKKALRKAAFAARKAAHDEDRDAAACDALMAFLESIGGDGIVAAYMPIRTEVSPLAVMARLDAAGRVVCVPVIEGGGRPLLFSRWRAGGEMVEGPFGARVPSRPDFVEPDIVVTPLVAYDGRGFRLGYGGGFYDRSFARLRALKPVTAIGFAYAAQRVDHVPTEPTDQRLDAVVSERGIERF